MIDITSEVIIDQPLTTVAQYAGNPDNVPLWYKLIKSVTWQTPKPLEKGSRIVFEAHYLEKQHISECEVVEYIPGQMLKLKTEDGPFPMETIYMWKPIDDHTTQMTFRNIGAPVGFSKFFSPFMGAIMKMANYKALLKLKEILEKTA